MGERRKPIQLPDELWLQIKTDFVVGNLSQRELGEKYEIPHSTINKRCAREGWGKERDEYRRTVYQKSFDKLAEDAAEEEASKLTLLLSASDRLDIMVDAMGVIVEKSDPSIRDLREYAALLKDATVIKRDLWSIPRGEEQTEFVVRFEGQEEYTV